MEDDLRALVGDRRDCSAPTILPTQVREKGEIRNDPLQPCHAARRAGRHLWTAAFFLRSDRGESQQGRIPDTKAVQCKLEGYDAGLAVCTATAELHARLRFFHWPLEFPEVFAHGGFDVVLCNPPWERIKLQQEEFFSTRDSRIAVRAECSGAECA